MGEGAGVRSSHCLDHKEKLGLVPSFATGCWHSGLFQAVTFPGFLGQGVSPVGSSIPGRFVHPWRPRSLCTAAPGQAEELLVPSSSRGAGLHSSSSWIFLGSTSSPFGSILPCRTHRAPTQPWAGSLFPVFAGKPSPRSPPWGQGELCPLGQEHERRKGLLWAGEGCLGSPGPSRPPPPAHELAPGTVLTHSGHLQLRGPCLPPCWLFLQGVGDTGTVSAGTECCMYFPPPPAWKCLGWAKFHIGWKTAGPGVKGEEP